MNKRYTRKLAITSSAAAIALLVALTGCTAETGETPAPEGPKEFVIGGVLPLSGSVAAFGEFVTTGAELAAEHIRESGVLGENTLSFTFEDGALDPQTTIIATQRVQERGINTVLTAGSAAILSQIPEAERTKTILVNVAAQSNNLFGVTDWLFNGLPSSNAELQQLVDLARGDLGLGRLAVLHVDSDIGVSDAETISRMWVAAGGEVVGTESYVSGATDMRTALTRIRAANPDALYISGQVGDMGYGIAQAKELGLSAQILGRTPNVDPQVFAVAGDAMEGMVGVGTIFRPSTPTAQQFVAAYEAKYGKSPSLYSAVTYDMVGILVKAYLAVGTDTTAVREWITGGNVVDYDGAMGLITVDENFVATYPLFAYMVKDGQVVDFAK